MKRINNYVLNGAIALLSTAGLVACSSSDDVTDAPVNPTYDGKSVKTQFAINIATPSNGKTRMSAENTQNGGNSLGMTNLYLFPLTSNHDDGADASTFRFPSIIALGDPSTIGLNDSHQVYNDVMIPVGTNSFLFYAKAKPQSGDTKFTQGSIKNSITDGATSPSIVNLNEVKFSLIPIIDAANDPTSDPRQQFADYLTKIAQASGWSTMAENTTLGKAYKNFTTMGTTGVRAGSANAILKTVSDIYQMAYNKKDDASEGIVATAIMTAITGHSTIKVKNISSEGEVPVLAYDGIDDKYVKFPVQQNLPEGAAQVKFENSSFNYVTEPVVGASGNQLNVYGLTYPAELTYWVNTPVKATTSDNVSWKSNTSDWDADETWTNWTDKVNANSRTVALRNNINYGVACLATTVRVKTTDLLDNAKTVGGADNDQTVVTPADGFKVTGLLVGGQPDAVEWNFLTSSTTDRDAVVYDDDVNITTAGGTNYTLLFDNWSSGNQEEVLVAIELENNSNTDFYGVDGVIKKNQKFYLLAKLSLNNTTPLSWPSFGSTYRFPQATVDRVFIQDFTTTANFTINSLKNAYVTIPDLRASKLQLGLSVDLKWQSGLTFEVPIE